MKLIRLPQCTFLDPNGKRFRCRSALKLKVHLDGEIYGSLAWVEVNLCVGHYMDFGGSFKPKANAKNKAKA